MPIIFSSVGVLFDARFTELFIWGFAFVFILVMLLIAKRLLRSQITSKVKKSPLPFGMSPGDLDHMKEDGLLTEEELKAVRATLARKIVERAQEEERQRKREGLKAEQVLPAEEQALRGGVAATPQPKAPARAPERPPLQRVPGRSAAPPSAGPSAPTTDASASLPPHLQQLLSKNEFELEELQTAGFITRQEAEQLRRAREVGG
jgi:hypothetical protein